MTRNRGKPVPDEEFRYWPAALEASSAGTLHRIGGLGVPYATRSRLLPGGFYEIVEPRSMAKTLGDKLDVVCRMEHHPEWLLATTESGSLRLTDDPAVGLSYEADLPGTGAGRDCYELVRSGRIRHSSMAFMAVHDEFRSQGATLVRHLTDIRLMEVSPVAQPGYLETSAAVRSLARQIGEDPEDIERLAAAGELRSLISDGGQPTVIDMAPTPLTVAQRSHDGGLDVQRRRWKTRPKGFRCKPATGPMRSPN